MINAVVIEQGTAASVCDRFHETRIIVLNDQMIEDCLLLRIMQPDMPNFDLMS